MSISNNESQSPSRDEHEFDTPLKFLLEDLLLFRLPLPKEKIEDNKVQIGQYELEANNWEKFLKNNSKNFGDFYDSKKTRDLAAFAWNDEEFSKRTVEGKPSYTSINKPGYLHPEPRALTPLKIMWIRDTLKKHIVVTEFKENLNQSNIEEIETRTSEKIIKKY